jgi:hypothetical protein
MTGRALLLASAFVAALVALATEKAAAANWLEKNFYLSGPQYEGKLPASSRSPTAASMPSTTRSPRTPG